METLQNIASMLLKTQNLETPCANQHSSPPLYPVEAYAASGAERQPNGTVALLLSLLGQSGGDAGKILSQANPELGNILSLLGNITKKKEDKAQKEEEKKEEGCCGTLPVDEMF